MRIFALVFVLLTGIMVFSLPAMAAETRDCPDYCADGVTYTRGTYNERTGTCDYAARYSCSAGCDARGTGCAAGAAVTMTVAERSCPDYCANGILYSRGSYNERTGSCEYSYRTSCDAGCDARGTGCAAAPVTTPAAVSRSCPDTCRDGIHYFNGAWNSVTQQCNYMSRTCVHGCDVSRTTCQRDPAGCPEYCRDGYHFYNGTWDEWAQQCFYAFRVQCDSGCDARGIGCTVTLTGTTPPESERYITCTQDCSCISRQAAVDRWGSAVQMCSGSPCGKASDGTYLYCIQPSAATQTLQTPGIAERSVTCPGDCSCIMRQAAVDRWGSAVQMCSGDPCGKASDGTYLYCIRPTEQSSAKIRERYSNLSEPVIAVNPALEGEQMMFIVSREQQGRLFGFIPVRMTVNTRLNATDLALLSEERPWWAFLAT